MVDTTPPVEFLRAAPPKKKKFFSNFPLQSHRLKRDGPPAPSEEPPFRPQRTLVRELREPATPSLTSTKFDVWRDPTLVNVRVTKEERRRQMFEALQRQAKSEIVIDHCSEEQLPLNGCSSAEELHANPNQMIVSSHSALYNDMLKKEIGDYKSRQRFSTWDAAVSSARNDGTENCDVQTSLRSSAHMDESAHNPLEPVQDSVQYSASIYTQKQLVIDGVDVYHKVISYEEERELCAELIVMTQRRDVSTYIPEECRYCVNLFETQLGIAHHAPLALSLFSSAPLLTNIFRRFQDQGLIPSSPNTAQISEFVGGYSGYPLQKKHGCLGPYLGMVNLLSPALLHLKHSTQMWSPKVYVPPGALVVFNKSVLEEYQIGFRKLNVTAQVFRHHTRHTKDYRMEVLFANVDVRQSKLLRVATSMTDYSHQVMERQEKLLSLEGKSSMENTIEQLVSDVNGVPADDVQRDLSRTGIISDKARPFLSVTSSAAQRLQRLKDKMSVRQLHLKEEVSVSESNVFFKE